MKKLSCNKWLTFFLPLAVLDVVNYLVMLKTYGCVDFTGSMFGEAHAFSTFSFIAMTEIIHSLCFIIFAVIIWLLNKDSIFIKVAVVRSVIFNSIVTICVFFTGFSAKSIDFINHIRIVFISANISYLWLPIISYLLIIWIILKHNQREQ